LRKPHFCVDEATLEIISVVASTNDVSDAEALPDLLQDVPGEIEQVSADGAYDQRRCYDTLNGHRARAAIPPRKGARICQHANTKAKRQVRDENLRRIRKVGRKEWKRESNLSLRQNGVGAGFTSADAILPKGHASPALERFDQAAQAIDLRAEFKQARRHWK
jgi:DDE family transposase